MLYNLNVEPNEPKTCFPTSWLSDQSGNCEVAKWRMAALGKMAWYATGALTGIAFVSGKYKQVKDAYLWCSVRPLINDG